MLLSFTSKLPEFGFPFASGVDLWRSWWHPGKGLLCYLTILGEDFPSKVWIKFNFAYFFFSRFYLTRNFYIFWPMNLQNHVKNISPGFTWLYRWERRRKGKTSSLLSSCQQAVYFLVKKVWILQFYQLIKSLKSSKSAVYFAIFQEEMTEFLSCDNLMPSPPLTSKTQKGLVSLQMLVSFESEVNRQSSALFC